MKVRILILKSYFLSIIYFFNSFIKKNHFSKFENKITQILIIHDIMPKILLYFGVYFGGIRVVYQSMEDQINHDLFHIQISFFNLTKNK